MIFYNFLFFLNDRDGSVINKEIKYNGNSCYSSKLCPLSVFFGDPNWCRWNMLGASALALDNIPSKSSHVLECEATSDTVKRNGKQHHV